MRGENLARTPFASLGSPSMSRFWSPLVNNLKPYVAGEQPTLTDLVKLNTNENPYGPSPRVFAAIAAEATDALRLYPDPRATRLCEALATWQGVQPDQVFVGNIRRSARAYFSGAAEP